MRRRSCAFLFLLMNYYDEQHRALAADCANHRQHSLLNDNASRFLRPWSRCGQVLAQDIILDSRRTVLDHLLPYVRDLLLSVMCALQAPMCR